MFAIPMAFIRVLRMEIFHSKRSAILAQAAQSTKQLSENKQGSIQSNL